MSSFGICCFRKRSGRETEVLILRRRYTYEYCMFVYGIYNSIAELKKILAGTTIDEKLVIMTGNFDRIFDKIWTGHRPEKYTKYKATFDNIMLTLTMPGLKAILETTVSVDLSWELPKGRKDASIETDIECACREFVEETGLPRESFAVSVMDHSRCYIRDFGALYTMKFWAAVMKDTAVEPLCTLGNKSYYEHDIIKFVNVSVAVTYLPEQMATVAKSLVKIIDRKL